MNTQILNADQILLSKVGQKVSDLKVGTKLESTYKTKYGFYSNIEVINIKETKTGRLTITYKYVFTSCDNEVTNGVQKISNGAINPNASLSEYSLKIKE